MKKVININFQGVVVPIEEDAYEIVQGYINDLRKYFEKEEGKDEIINDIESRIGELFQSRLKEGAACITEADANKILDTIGRVKDFQESDFEDGGHSDKASEEKSTDTSSEGKDTYTATSPKRLFRNTNDRILGGVCSGIANYIGIDPWVVRILFIITGIGFLAYLILWAFLPTGSSLESPAHKRFYRNPDEKIIGGVCGGIGSYFNINPWIPRVIFLIPFFNTFRLSWINWQFNTWDAFPHFGRLFFSPTLVIIYIILWIIIPEAKTTSEKLQMKGEKVDINSIKESVTKEMRGAGEGLKRAGDEAKNFFKGKASEVNENIKRNNHSGLSAIGRIIVTLIKVFLYIIVGAIVFALLVSLLAVAVAGVGVFPLKNFIVPAGVPTVFAWLSLILLILIPVITLITYIISKLAKRGSLSPIVRNAGIASFILGFFALAGLGFYLKKEFTRSSDEIENTIQLENPNVEEMTIQPINNKNTRMEYSWKFNGRSWWTIGDDSLVVGNTKVRILKSATDQFSVKYIPLADGATVEKANASAANIPVKGYQEGNTLYLSNSITISKDDQFRNQTVEMLVYVPVGHQFKVDRSFKDLSGPNIYFYNWKRSSDDDTWGSSYGYKTGITYTMTEDGPVRADDGSLDVSPSTKMDKIDSLKDVQEQKLKEMDRALDSIKKAKKALLDD